jgi:hypothetical protein
MVNFIFVEQNDSDTLITIIICIAGYVLLSNFP